MFRLNWFLAIMLLLSTPRLTASDWRLLSLSGSGDNLVYTFGDMQGVVRKNNITKIWIQDVPYLNIKTVLQKHISSLTPECDKLYNSGYVPKGISSFNMKMDDATRKSVIEILIYSELVMKTNEVTPKRTSLYEFNISKKQFRIPTAFEPNKLPETYPENVTPPWYFIAPDTIAENILKGINKNLNRK